MPNYQAQVTIWPTSNLLADASTNTWSFVSADVAFAEDFLTDIEVFYKSIVSLYPNTTRQSGHTIKVYDRADPTPRAPVLEGTFDFTAAPTGGPLPTEVALCLSFQADQESGVPQARRRGRVFLGPCRSTVLEADGRPTASVITVVTNAADALLTASDASSSWKWMVYSTVNAEPYLVTNGWVDNEFDTQRRRGRVATARTTFP